MSKQHDAVLFVAADKWAIALDRATKAEENGDDFSVMSHELKTAIVALYDAIVARRIGLTSN